MLRDILKNKNTIHPPFKKGGLLVSRLINKDSWRETTETIRKWLKKIFDLMMKIGKWITETMSKISKAIWEGMEKRFGDND